MEPFRRAASIEWVPSLEDVPMGGEEGAWVEAPSTGSVPSAISSGEDPAQDPSDERARRLSAGGTVVERHSPPHQPPFPRSKRHLPLFRINPEEENAVTGIRPESGPRGGRPGPGRLRLGFAGQRHPGSPRRLAGGGGHGGGGGATPVEESGAAAGHRLESIRRTCLSRKVRASLCLMIPVLQLRYNGIHAASVRRSGHGKER